MNRHQILPERRLIVLELEGPQEASDLEEAYRLMTSDPAFSSEYSGVIDLRKAKLLLDADETELFATYIISEAASKAPWAYLVSSPKGTALTHFYSQLVEEQHPTKIFSTVGAAARYLDVRLDDLLVEAL